MSELSFEVNFNFFPCKHYDSKLTYRTLCTTKTTAPGRKLSNAWEDFQAICKQDAIWEEENEKMFPERWSGSQSEKPQNN